MTCSSKYIKRVFIKNTNQKKLVKLHLSERGYSLKNNNLNEGKDLKWFSPQGSKNHVQQIKHNISKIWGHGGHQKKYNDAHW